MREFTKSLFSFSWAMSLFGVQQTTNLMSPDKAVKAFESVTEATQTQLGEAMKSTFSAGDKLQRGAIDLMLGPFTGEALNPGRWTRMASDMVKQSSEAVTKGVQGATSVVQQAAATVMPQGSGVGTGPAPSSGSSAESTGWGPMPS